MDCKCCKQSVLEEGMPGEKTSFLLISLLVTAHWNLSSHTRVSSGNALPTQHPFCPWSLGNVGSSREFPVCHLCLRTHNTGLGSLKPALLEMAFRFDLATQWFCLQTCSRKNLAQSFLILAFIYHPESLSPYEQRRIYITAFNLWDVFEY